MTNNQNIGNVSRWLIIGALGILLIVAQHLAKTLVYIIFAVGLMLAGGAGALSWWKNRSLERGELVNLVASAALFIVGLWILRNPDGFDKIINVIIGLVLIVAGVYWLNLSRTASDRLMSILSIVSIVLGVIITFSHAGTTWIVKAEGFSLVYSAVTGLIGEKVLKI